MYPITHHHIEPTDPHDQHNLPEHVTQQEKRHEIYRLIGRIALDLAGFAVVAAVLWWIMVKV